MRISVSLMLVLTMTQTPVFAQTDREKAVAIDRIEIPPTEKFQIDAVGPELQFPWSLAFLPNGDMLVTEKHKGLRRITAEGSASGLLSGLPTNFLAKEDSGFLDIVLDPDFATNAFIYVAFVEGTEESNRTAIWKAKLAGNTLVGGRIIFRSNVAKKAPSHPGGRMLFLPDNTLLLTVGDGYDYRDQAQNPASHLGKVLRLNREGNFAADNPFVGRNGYAPEIWTTGHRNIQGLMRDSITGRIWAHEHGPRGGDEINLLEAGKNYGWPKALLGIDYDGTRVSDLLHVDGMEDPHFYWAPSIAPSGFAVYHGTAFPDWEGKFLVGALASRGLVLLRQGKDSGRFVEEARLLTGLRARIRDVRIAPDGSVYLLYDDEKGRILRLSPELVASANLPSEHHLAPIAMLEGRWTGASQFRPLADQGKRVIDETSATDCRMLLKSNHMRCTSKLTRLDGRVRIVEQTFSRDPESSNIHASVVGDRWPSYSVDKYVYDAASGIFTAEKPYKTGGRKYIERVSLAPSNNGSTVQVIESARPIEGGAWTETFRWIWSRAKPR